MKNRLSSYVVITVLFAICFMTSCDKDESTPNHTTQSSQTEDKEDNNNDDKDDGDEIEEPEKSNGEAPDAEIGADNITDEIITGGCAELGYNNIVLYGYVNNVTPTQMGIIYDTDESFTNKKYAYSNSFDQGTSNRRFRVTIQGLRTGQKYYYYAFIKKGDIEYSAEQVYSFTTKDNPKVGSLTFNFDDNFELTTIREGDQYPFYAWTEQGLQWWATSNAGYRTTGLKAAPMDYPACPDLGTGVNGGNCVKLQTCSTGSLGAMVNMRIAAGCLFSGSFDTESAMKEPLAATRFGLPYAHKPTNMKGYYKYKPGAKMQDRSGIELSGVTDSPDICCVIYRNMDNYGNPVQLDGTNILTSPAIVGMGRINQSEIDKTGSQWLPFNIPINYKVSIAKDDVLSSHFNIAIVFTSSIRGGEFIGAIGSTLWIDNVALTADY